MIAMAPLLASREPRLHSHAEIARGSMSYREHTETILGDELVAEQKNKPDGTMKGHQARLNEYRAAVRANRQLAVALQAQGLNEEAARFAYRAQRLQRIVYRPQ